VKIPRTVAGLYDILHREPIPARPFKLLVFLLSQALPEGECKPGNAAMCEAIRNTGLENGSVHTVNACLDVLARLGWISRINPTRPRSIYLRVPKRYRPLARQRQDRTAVAKDKIVRFSQKG
jgi:hypothetical protein